MALGRTCHISEPCFPICKKGLMKSTLKGCGEDNGWESTEPSAWHLIWVLSVNASFLFIPLRNCSIPFQDSSPLPNLGSVYWFKWVHNDCIMYQLKVWLLLSESLGSNHGSIYHLMCTLKVWAISLKFSFCNSKCKQSQGLIKLCGNYVDVVDKVFRDVPCAS